MDRFDIGCFGDCRFVEDDSPERYREGVTCFSDFDLKRSACLKRGLFADVGLQRTAYRDQGFSHVLGTFNLQRCASKMQTSALLSVVILGLLYCHGVATADLLSQARASEGDNLHVIWNRHLLQSKTPCSVNFQTQNYTIITSNCKGPTYPPKACCDAFVKFACPFAAEINDLSNDCADRMFSYININGNYPPGLFANECTNGTSQGLPCPATAPSANQTSDPSRAVQQKSGHEICWLAVFILGTIMSLNAM